MAYLKIFPIKVTDKKALDYITNPDKTDEKLLVSSFGCSPETADLEFSMTREMAKKNGMDKGDNLAFHLIQSFKPGEVDAENAHRLQKQSSYLLQTHLLSLQQLESAICYRLSVLEFSWMLHIRS